MAPTTQTKQSFKCPPSFGAKEPRTARSRRIRTIFTPDQLRTLEEEFSNQMYLVGDDRVLLAKSLNLSEIQVKVWFQNRRIKHRKLNQSGSAEQSPDLQDTSNSLELPASQPQTELLHQHHHHHIPTSFAPINQHPNNNNIINDQLAYEQLERKVSYFYCPQLNYNKL